MDKITTKLRRGEAASVKAYRPSGYSEGRASGLKPHWLDDWQDGAPPHVSEARVAVDLQLYGHARCGRCHHRTLSVKAQHRRCVGSYRVLGTCRSCKHEETF